MEIFEKTVCISILSEIYEFEVGFPVDVTWESFGHYDLTNTILKAIKRFSDDITHEYWPAACAVYLKGCVNDDNRLIVPLAPYLAEAGRYEEAAALDKADESLPEGSCEKAVTDLMKAPYKVNIDKL